jgi:hypothetical protein
MRKEETNECGVFQVVERHSGQAGDSWCEPPTQEVSSSGVTLPGRVIMFLWIGLAIEAGGRTRERGVDTG